MAERTGERSFEWGEVSMRLHLSSDSCRSHYWDACLECQERRSANLLPDEKDMNRNRAKWMGGRHRDNADASQ